MHQLTLYDLTQQMVRRFSTFVLLVAALIAVEPLFHNHPLEQTRIPSPCAVCVTGTAPLPQVVAAPEAPRVVVYTLTTFTVPMVAEAVETAIPSRAPPAA